MNQQDIAAIFNGYELHKWMDWIDDLLHFETAYPVLDIPPDRDQLTEVPVFLEKHGMSTRLYGMALIDTFHRTITVFQDSPYLERLLDAVIAVRPSNSTEVLRTLFLNAQTDKVKLPNRDPVKGLLLLGLSKSFLEYHHFQEILGYCRTIGLPLLKTNAHFMGHYLRFVARKAGVKYFFAELTYLFQHLPAQHDQLPLAEDYLATLQEAFEEVWFYQTGIFYTEYYAWVVGDFETLQSLPLFTWLITTQAQDIGYLFDITSTDPRKQHKREYIVALRSFVILWNDNYLKKEIGASLIHLFTYFFVNHGGEEIVKRVLKKNQQHIQGFVWLYEREITDVQGGSEEVSDDEIFHLLTGIFRRFYETKPAMDYTAIRNNPDALNKERQRMRSKHAANFQLLLANSTTP